MARARCGTGPARRAWRRWAALAVLSAAASAAAEPAADRGAYVMRAAGCVACHTRPAPSADEPAGPPLAGGRAFDTPFGRFYSPNITPHPERGIGRWSADDLARALSRGVGPGGLHYYPVFPYPTYTRMRREDVDALHTHLMTLAAHDARSRPHALPWFMRWRFANRVWAWLFLDSGPWRDDPQRSSQWNRGAYLVNALGHCGECHTPRNLFGALDRDRHLAGNPRGPDGEQVPNITPHDADGIGRWSESEIVEYLRSGMTPELDFVGGAMVEVVEESTSHLSDDDRRAIAVYLKSLPPAASAAD